MGYVRYVYITVDPAISAHSLAFPWRRMTTACDARVTRRAKLNDNRDDSATLAVEYNLSENRSISIPRKTPACSKKEFVWSFPAAISDISSENHEVVTLPFGDSCTEGSSKNVVWASSKKGIFAVKVDSACQRLYLGFH